MKQIFNLKTKKTLTIVAILLMAMATTSFGQVSVVCTNPTNTAYGLTNAGEIYEINNATGATIRIIKNNVYAGNAPFSANGLGFNIVNSTFYYFKRNYTSGSPEFVSFTPATNTVTLLAASTCTDDIHTGCVNYTGRGYYTTDIQGTLNYYDIRTNKWTFITNKIVDQNGNNVTNIIKTQNAGDMALDWQGNMWMLTSSTTNYALYKFPGALPTTPVAQVNVIRVINPTAVTPTGNAFAGIAFKPNGQVLMATRGDDKLYLLQNLTTLTFLGNLTTPDVGNDLTSCSFPAGVLPVSWKSFEATVQNNNNVVLNWEVTESQNKGFYVQHSINGSDWDDLAFVASKSNHESETAYSYTHTTNLNGRHYYRIKQVDVDDKISYSEIVSVTIKNDNQNIAIWPNPATDQVRINGTDGRTLFTKAQVFDLSGRMLAQKQLQGNTGTINVKELPAGTYLIRVQSDNGTVCNQKFVKQ